MHWHAEVRLELKLWCSFIFRQGRSLIASLNLILLVVAWFLCEQQLVLPNFLGKVFMFVMVLVNHKNLTDKEIKPTYKGIRLAQIETTTAY